MTLAIALIVIGILVGFGSFVYAALNMKNMVQGKSALDRGFGRHIGAMIGLAVGGLLVASGAIIGVVGYLRH